jgi:APA family basic amino acid/polyamine antiporter
MRLKPTLGLFTSITLVIGGMIGSGIFKNPAAMADLVRSPELLLGVWLIAGAISLFGALTNAEVSGMIPATGGQYQYFRVMYGEFTAFIFGWAQFIVVATGSIASITFVFSIYFDAVWTLPSLPEATWRAVAFHLPFGTIYPLQDIGIKALTALLVILLTIVNYIGVREGGIVQALFTVAKIAAILFIVAAAFWYSGGTTANFKLDHSAGAPLGMALVGAVVIAVNKALWAYDGWNNITFIGGEVKDPQRNIPRALIVGVASVISVYVLINLAYLYVLPVDQLSASGSVAADVARITLGPWGLMFVSIAVMISTLGTSNGTILVTGRLFYSMATERMFFRSANKVHERFATPHTALVWQCVWTCMLIFTGTFDMLTEMLIFVSFGFYALGGIGVFVLRKKMPDAERPYKAWGYPVVPALFVLFCIAFLGFSLYADVDNYHQAIAAGKDGFINSVYGLVLMATGLPFYWWFRRSHQASRSES